MSIVFELGRSVSPTSGDTGRQARAVLSWFLALARAVAAGFVAVVGGLVMWSVLPTALGWDSHVVVSGSMAPRIQAGDVVLTEPIPPAAIKPGYVIAFEDPSHPGRKLLHRVEGISPDGSLVTRGDANSTADSTAVSPAAVGGLGRLRVPYVGLPVLWQSQGDVCAIAFAVLGLLALGVFAGRDRAGDEDPEIAAGEDGVGRDGADAEDVDRYCPTSELLPALAPGE